jgi:hypothetical protein
MTAPKRDANRQASITRRSAIRTTGLAAIAAGLLGATRIEAASALPLIVGTVSNMDDLAAEVALYVKRGNAAWSAEDDAEAALSATLSPEQHVLFRAYADARNDRETAHENLYISEIARHLPGLAPAIWAIWFHMTESGGGTGQCCLPETGDA